MTEQTCTWLQCRFTYKGVAWAQDYALEKRALMMTNIIRIPCESGLETPMAYKSIDTRHGSAEGFA